MGLNLVKNEYQKIRKELRDMEDEIKALRGKGVHEYEGQSMVVSEQYATAIAEGRSDKTIKQLKSAPSTRWPSTAAATWPFATSSTS